MVASSPGIFFTAIWIHTYLPFVDKERKRPVTSVAMETKQIQPMSNRRELAWLLLALITCVLTSAVAMDASNSGAIVSNGHVVDVTCPAFCRCYLTDSIQLSVNCTTSPDVKDFAKTMGLMFDQHPNISTLVIHNSGITDMASLQLCKLQALVTLDVSNNTLGSLGEGLLQCLHNLRHLSAGHNDIKAIAESTFKGLDWLSDLSLQYNNITHISPAAFTGLKAIKKIDLSHNQLESLDIWPLYLAVKTSIRNYIDVSHNEIRIFTNDLKWNYDPLQTANYYMDLSHNQVQYLSDFRRGWGLQRDIDLYSIFRLHSKIDFRLNPLLCDCVDFNIYKFTKHLHYSDWATEMTCNRSGIIEFRPNRMSLSDLVCHLTTDCPSGCDCVERPADTTVNINCQNLQLQDLPLAIPTQTVGYYDYDFQYVVRLTNNAIKTISYRTYFNLLDVGDFSQNEITLLDKDILQQWSLRMSGIYLDNNALSTLPQEITSMEFKNLRNMTLHQNPWNCDCEHTWFKSWILNMTGKIWNVNAVLCGSPARLQGRSITTIPDEEFCTDPVQDNIIRVISITVSVIGSLVVVIPTSLAVAYHMRVRVFAKLKLHPFNHDECPGENKDFDVFVSYATEDEDWVRNLIRVLEEEGYQTLFHRRDFISGESITANVALAVERSKRTLCVLSRDFAASDMCMWEFTTALNIDLLENKHRLITIMKEAIPVEEQDPSLKDYLRRFTYIEADAKHFWENLFYSLPVKKLGQNEDETTTD